MNPQPLTHHEKAVFEWQMWTPGFGEEGQERIKGATVMVSRCGGLGGVVAYELAAAGVGHLVLAHGGLLKPSDLNRQLLMTHDWIGKPRMESIERRLKELNPALKITAVPENVHERNAAELVALADVVVSAAPLFEERFAMNREAVRQGTPMIDCAMYEMTGTVFSIRPGQSACLRCVVPEKPAWWKRQFPVFGAVSAVAGSLGAMEAIKIITGIGEPLYDTMVHYELDRVRFQKFRIARNPNCPDCGHLSIGTPDAPGSAHGKVDT